MANYEDKIVISLNQISIFIPINDRGAKCKWLVAEGRNLMKSIVRGTKCIDLGSKKCKKEQSCMPLMRAMQQRSTIPIYVKCPKQHENKRKCKYNAKLNSTN